MFNVLQILSVIFTAVATTTTLAHALELPGKLRLTRDEYLTVQRIYYPGFTIGGAVGELGGLVAVLLLLLVSPITWDGRFWLMVGAFLALAAMHAMYWLLARPVNNFWLKDRPMAAVSSRFFSVRAGRDGEAADWTQLRNIWEYSHVARAVFAAGTRKLVVQGG